MSTKHKETLAKAEREALKEKVTKVVKLGKKFKAVVPLKSDSKLQVRI